MFDKVWKKQIVKPTSKVGLWKPSTEIKLVQEDKDDKCCEEARRRILDLSQYFNEIPRFEHDYTDWAYDKIEEFTCDELHTLLEDTGYDTANKLQTHFSGDLNYHSLAGSKSDKFYYDFLREMDERLDDIIDKWDRCESGN